MTLTVYVVEYCRVGITQVLGRTVSQIVVPLILRVYLVTGVPPSNVVAPHETVNLLIASATAVKRDGEPGTEFGVCIADAVFAVDSVVAWSVTVTTLNSYAVGSVLVGVVGAGVGAVTAASATTGADDQLGDEIGSIRMLAIRITGSAALEILDTDTRATRATVAVEGSTGTTGAT